MTIKNWQRHSQPVFDISNVQREIQNTYLLLGMWYLLLNSGIQTPQWWAYKYGRRNRKWYIHVLVSCAVISVNDKKINYWAYSELDKKIYILALF